MPGLFWKPHSSHVTPAAGASSSAPVASIGANAVPQARQNWASSLFSVLHTEQSLVIPSASLPPSPGSKDDTLLCERSQFCKVAATQNASIPPRRLEPC